MRESRIAGALLWLVLAAGPAWAVEIPYRLADINRTPDDPSSVRVSEEPAGFFELGGRLLFSTVGSDNADGGILWSTDGTAQGTVQLSSSLCAVPCHNIVPLQAWNGIALLRSPSRSTARFSSGWPGPSTPSPSSGRPTALPGPGGCLS